MGNTLMGYLAAKNDVRAPHIKPEQNPAPSHKIPNNARFAPQGPAPKGNRFSQGGHIAPPPVKKSGGGSWWNPVHDIGAASHALGNATHWTGSKIDLAAHDIQAMPAGFVKTGEAIAHDSTKLSASVNRHLGLRVDPFQKKADKTPYQTPALAKASVIQAKDSVIHPARDPFQGLLTAVSVASLGAGSAARLGAVGDAVSAAGEDASLASRAGAAAKALAKKPEMPNRILQNPSLRYDKKAGVWKTTKNPFQLTASQRPLPRLIQHIHDKVIQNSLDNANNVHGGRRTLTKRYADRRVHGARDETMRRTTQIDQGLPMQIAHAGRRAFGRSPYGVLSKKEGEAAIAMRSWQVLPHEIVNRLDEVHPSGDNPEALAFSHLANALHQKGVLKSVRGKVQIDAKLYPELARADKLAKGGQAAREAIINRYNLMSPEGLAARKALPAEVLRSEAARNSDTGVRTGDGFTSLKTSQKGLPAHPRPAAASNGVIGVPKSFIEKKMPATGEGILKGLVPDDTTGNIARATKQAFDYKEKMAARDALYHNGSDISTHPNDHLIRSPQEAAKPLDTHTKQALGQELSTLDTVGEEQGLHQGFLNYMRDITNPTKAGEVGVKAQKGTRWVSEGQVGDLGKGVTAVSPRRGFTKKVDALNSGITGVTVYAKPSHVPQRLITDATTSALSGSLFSPKTMAFVRALKKGGLSEQDLMEAKQASGVHGYLALPHEGDSKMARFASRGANAYANRIDAPFRFLNLAHEARRAGIDSPAEFKKMLAYAKDPSRRIPIKAAQKYEQVLKRSNRVSMMYDGMTANERAGIARLMWFYPWTKAAARYGGHVAMEHPVVSAAGVNEGVQGREWQKKAFGALPSFEYGLIPVHGGHESSSAGWLTPFNTTGQVVEMARHPTQVAGNLNPVAGAVATAFGGPNSYGEIAPGGPGYPSIKEGLSELFAPTPEASILKDYLDQKAAARKTHMFPHSWQDDIMTRLIGGPSWPKKTTKKALHKAKQREDGAGYNLFIPNRKH